MNRFRQFYNQSAYSIWEKREVIGEEREEENFWDRPRKTASSRSIQQYTKVHNMAKEVTEFSKKQGCRPFFLWTSQKICKNYSRFLKIFQIDRKSGKIWNFAHTCLDEFVGPMNCSRYMAGILVRSILKLTRIHWKLNDLSMAFSKIDQFVVFLC